MRLGFLFRRLNFYGSPVNRKNWLPRKFPAMHTVTGGFISGMGLVDVNLIKLLGYSLDIVVKSQIYAMKFVSWHSKGIVKGFS